MCGSQLGGAARGEQSDEIEAILNPQAGEDKDEPSYLEPDAEFREPIEELPVRSAHEAARNPYDLSLFQGLRESELAGDSEDEQSPSVRYRYYIGAVLAILIFALGYMAWSGSRANQSSRGTPPPAPPAAVESAQPPANQNTEPSASNPPKEAAAPQAAPPAANNTAAASAPKAAETPKPPVNTANVERTPASTPATTSLPSQPAAAVGMASSVGNGAEEFAMAQRYLSGQPRDSAEAAKWLWKAMAKHNGPSMVALADLYLKGDGVSKNCDQARVLLDSAAQRGMAGAGERLRNLQAFGCQ
jgi:hypothetical protein